MPVRLPIAALLLLVGVVACSSAEAANPSPTRTADYTVPSTGHSRLPASPLPASPLPADVLTPLDLTGDASFTGNSFTGNSFTGNSFTGATFPGATLSGGQVDDAGLFREGGSPIRTAGFISPDPDASLPNPAWRTEVLPADLLYRSYIANPKDARLSSRILQESGGDLYWSLEAGTRVGLLRYGTPSGWRNRETGRPEGWQLDIAGAAFPRLNFDHELDVDAVDFKVGVPLTYSEGPWEAKFGFYHLSSHVGDELLLRDPTVQRINYVRDAAVLGGGYYVNPDLRLYSEVEYAVNYDGGSEPWHVQFGFDYQPARVNPDLHAPSPFLAVNTLLREEVDWGGGVNVVTGVQWRGPRSDRLFRLGLQYYNGKSWQFSFFDQHEELLGLSIWYDF